LTERSPDAVLAALVKVAVEATDAARGRIFATVDGTHLQVAAASGGDEAWRSPTLGDGGIARPETHRLVAFVVATGQPQVLTSQGRAVAGAPPPPPMSALCAPCIRNDEVVGALELVDKAGGKPFSIDDLEMASLFAGLAAAAFVARRVPETPDPAQLVGDLRRLASAEPDRYATVARLVHRMLQA
jgi:GAF domain-containing protein